MSRGPYLGEDVHYQAFGTPGGEHQSVCRAAKITELLGDGRVSLVVFNPTGLYFNQCDYAPTNGVKPPGGTWHHQH